MDCALLKLIPFSDFVSPPISLKTTIAVLLMVSPPQPSNSIYNGTTQKHILSYPPNTVNEKNDLIFRSLRIKMNQTDIITFFFFARNRFLIEIPALSTSDRIIIRVAPTATECVEP